MDKKLKKFLTKLKITISLRHTCCNPHKRLKGYNKLKTDTTLKNNTKQHGSQWLPYCSNSGSFVYFKIIQERFKKE